MAISLTFYPSQNIQSHDFNCDSNDAILAMFERHKLFQSLFVYIYEIHTFLKKPEPEFMGDHGIKVAIELR